MGPAGPFASRGGVWVPHPRAGGGGCRCRWITGAQPKSWSLTSTAVGTSTGSPSSVTSSRATPKGQCCGQGGDGGSPGCPWALLTPFHHSYAYIEFEEQSSVKAAVELDESVFRGRVIKVRAGGGPGGLPPPHSQPWVPVAVLNPSSSSPSPPSRCCPRGPTCLASAAPTAGATGATSTPGQGWAAGEATTGGSSPGCEGGPTGESLGVGFLRCGAGCSWDGVPCSPLPSWHGWEDGEGLWQEGTSGILQLSPCPCRNSGSGGWAST